MPSGARPSARDANVPKSASRNRVCDMAFETYYARVDSSAIGTSLDPGEYRASEPSALGALPPDPLARFTRSALRPRSVSLAVPLHRRRLGADARDQAR